MVIHLVIDAEMELTGPEWLLARLLAFEMAVLPLDTRLSILLALLSEQLPGDDDGPEG